MEEYPKIFQQQKKELLSFNSKQNTSTYQNVFATFEVSAKYLQRIPGVEGADALDLLHVLAFFHNISISEILVQKASAYASVLIPAETEHTDDTIGKQAVFSGRLPELYLHWREGGQKRVRWRKARALLKDLSIVTVQEEEKALSISLHPLIHDWAKER